MISSEQWGEADGRPVELYTLVSGRGMTVRIATFGGTVQSLLVPDRSGSARNVALGFPSLGGYAANLAAPLVACTIGMNTPRTSIVTRTVASAAKLGAALRRIERIASRKKKPNRMISKTYANPGGRVDGARMRRANSRVVSSRVYRPVASSRTIRPRANSSTRRRILSTIA